MGLTQLFHAITHLVDLVVKPYCLGRDDVIYGERFGDLLPVLGNLAKGWRINNDGMCQLYGEFDANLVMPFFRALMRAEAELLLEDADALGPDQYDQRRTHDQRSADAFVRLAEAVCALP